jgi:cell division septation protein DedD
MDSAMRDLERMRERDEGEGGRKLALLALAGVATAGIVLALCFRAGGTTDDTEAEADPLSRLDRASGLAPAEAPAEDEAEPEPEIDRVALTFPERLTGAPASDPPFDPEVAAALAAASAELRHPDPLPAVPVVHAGLAERAPATLPAALAAGSSGTLERALPHDPLLQSALPVGSIGEAAPEGHDGEFTVQVISYDSPEGAHAFAAGLRARGHRAFVLQAEVEGRGPVYRVRIGPFETMAEAQTYRRTFEESERMNTIVVRQRDTAP